jgi:pimeloyl-ACP methyl ester carboxylesterase
MRQKLALSLTVLALLAALAVAVTAWQAARAEARAMAAYPPDGQFVTVEGVRMHAVVRGSGPDLVLIHGASGSVRDFTFDLLPALSARYRVIAVDRPGFGWSDPAAAEDIHTQARLIRTVAASLGADRPIVVGHSYGGAVALAWAVDAPEHMAALVTLAGPSHIWSTPLPRFYQVTTNPIGNLLAVPMLTAFVPQHMIDQGVEGVFAPQPAPPGYVKHFGPEMSLRRQTMRINGRQRAGLKAQIAAMVPSYGQIDLPVELVHGDADSTVSYVIHAEKLVRDVVDAHLTLLPGVGHMPHHVAMPEVIAAIDRAATRAGLGR